MTTVRALGLCAAAALLASSAAEARSAKLEYRVTCKDNTTARPGRGACGHHGGIAKDGKSGVLCMDGTLSDDKAPNICKGHKGAATMGAGVVGKDDVANKPDKDLGANSDKVSDDKRGKRSRADRDADRNGRTDDRADRNANRADRNADRNNDAKATVACKDGTSATGRLGCFGHGGIAEGQKDANPPVRDSRTGAGGDEPGGVTENPTGATARCKDGTYSHARHHTGACSRHGGVDQWLDK